MKVDIPESKREKIVQFIKFGLVGVSNNLICYGTYVLLVSIGMHYVPSNIIGFSISVFNAFYWNNKYVFSDSNVWVEIFGIPEVIAPIINLIVTVPINFLTNKYWAYKSK